MNLTLAIVLGAAGAVLILVGAVGGGFTVPGISMPPVGVFPRLISFVAGAVLVVFALGVYEWDTTGGPGATTTAQQPPPTSPATQAPAEWQPSTDQDLPDPVIAPVVTPPGYEVYLYTDVSTAASIEAGLSNGQNVAIICTMQGEPVTSAITGHTSSLWNAVAVDNGTVGFVPDVHVDTQTFQPTMPHCESVLHSSTTA